MKLVIIPFSSIVVILSIVDAARAPPQPCWGSVSIRSVSVIILFAPRLCDEGASALPAALAVEEQPEYFVVREPQGAAACFTSTSAINRGYRVVTTLAVIPA